MLINDLDKLMEEMGEKRHNNLHRNTAQQPTGIIPMPEDNANTSIEPCTGLIEKHNALLGDIYIPDDIPEETENGK